MFYENELRFLCDTLQKCHIKVLILDMALPLTQRLEALELPAQLGGVETAAAFVAQYSLQVAWVSKAAAEPTLTISRLGLYLNPN